MLGIEAKTRLELASIILKIDYQCLLKNCFFTITKLQLLSTQKLQDNSLKKLFTQPLQYLNLYSQTKDYQVSLQKKAWKEKKKNIVNSRLEKTSP